MRAISSLGFTGDALELRDRDGVIMHRLRSVDFPAAATIAQLETRLQAWLDLNVNPGLAEYMAVHIYSRSPLRLAIARFSHRPRANWWAGG